MTTILEGVSRTFAEYLLIPRLTRRDQRPDRVDLSTPLAAVEPNQLARFKTGDPLLARVPTDRGAVYFCTTLPRASHSSLARDGVVFYVMLQRALAQGAAMLGSARQISSRIDAISAERG